MSFFNLTLIGNQNIYKDFESRNKNTLPPINSSISKNSDSNLKYHTLRTKHVRSQEGPTQLYARPLTCSQQVGWWVKDDPIRQNLPWANVKKHVFPKSEMTSFADQMCLADKSFKMY